MPAAEKLPTARPQPPDGFQPLEAVFKAPWRARAQDALKTGEGLCQI